MTTIGSHGLSCLDGTSYAAIPLGLQANAQAVDSTVAGVQASLLAYGNRYTASFVTTSSITIFDNSGTLLHDGTAAGTVIFKNLGVLPRGWYAASASQSYQATGAVTAGSFRRSILQIGLGDSSFPPTFFQATTMESNTGAADSMTVNGWFYSDASEITVIQSLFGHGNTGSSMLIPAGATLTVRFLTSGLVT